MRSLAVVAFIAIVAGAGLYLGQRPTIARGDVIAAELLTSNAKVVHSVDCDPEVPLAVDGAVFWCRVEYLQGAATRMKFNLDRSGLIKQAGDANAATPTTMPIDKSDPWR